MFPAAHLGADWDKPGDQALDAIYLRCCCDCIYSALLLLLLYSSLMHLHIDHM
jgi:hypothetical protein